MIIQVLVVGSGGFLGAVLRFLIDQLLTPYCLELKKTYFFLPTLIINLIGSFGMGYFLSLGKLKFGETFLYFFTTGVLGAFTTFSTFSWQLHQMMTQGLYLEFLALVLLSVLGGFACVHLGYMMAST